MLLDSGGCTHSWWCILKTRHSVSTVACLGSSQSVSSSGSPIFLWTLRNDLGGPFCSFRFLKIGFQLAVTWIEQRSATRLFLVAGHQIMLMGSTNPTGKWLTSFFFSLPIEWGKRQHNWDLVLLIFMFFTLCPQCFYAGISFSTHRSLLYGNCYWCAISLATCPPWCLKLRGIQVLPSAQ